MINSDTNQEKFAQGLVDLLFGDRIIRNLMLKAVFLAWLLGCCGELAANTLEPDSAELDDQLSNSITTSLAEDRLGFLWIGTRDGLNRYDGYKVEIFHSRTSNLSHDDISALVVDAQDNLWVGTRDGLNLFQQQTGRFINYFHNPAEPLTLASNKILSLAADAQGGVWVGTAGGISYFQSDTNSFKSFPIINRFGIRRPVEEVSSLYIDSEQTVWLGTTDGAIAIFDPKKQQFDLVDLPDELDAILQILEIAPEQYYLLTQKELYLWSPSRKTLQVQDLTNFGIDNPFVNVTQILKTQDQGLWLATRKNGVYSYQADQHTNHYHYTNHTQDRLGVNRVEALLQDRTGVVWLGTGAYLQRINPNRVNFQHYFARPNFSQNISAQNLVGDSTFSILIDSDNWLWVGSEFDGISLLKPKGTAYEMDLEASIKDWDGTTINGILEGSAGKLWIIASQKLWQYDKLTNNLEPLNHFDFKGATLFSGAYHHGGLWLATSKGLWEINNDGKITQHLIEQKNYSHKNIIYGLMFDQSKKFLWLATEQGLLRFYPDDKRTEGASQYLENSPSALNSPVFDIHQDIHGRLWVATYGSGLLRLDLTIQSYEQIHSDNSNLNDVIYSVVADENHFMWLATARGLYRLDPNSLSLSHFTLDQGQPIYDFNLGAKAVDKKGRIYLGGINGLISFDPKSYFEDKTQAIPVITQVLVNNNPARVGSDETAHSKLPVNRTDLLTLFSQDNSVTFEFSGMHFANPKANRFRYMLEGYDQDWIEVGASNRSAVYAKLEPNQYRFRLMASNKDGLWSPMTKDLVVEVLPSPYLSGWAILAYTLALLMFVGTFGYIMRARFKERREAQSKLQESEERLKLSLWGSGDELWDWDMQTGALHLSNEWEQDFPRDGIRSGYSDANSNIHPNDLSYVKQALNAHINGKSQHFESTYRISDDNGGWIWVLDQGKTVEFDRTRPIRMAGTIKNITDLKDAEQQLNVIVKSFENISDAVWILDDNLTYIVVNKAFESITGYVAEEVIGAPMHENAIHGMTDDFYQQIMQTLAAKGSWQGELEAVKSNGDIYPIEINVDAIRDNDGTITNYVGVFSDITYRKKAEHELRRLATTDQLTNLPNRSTFRKEVEYCLRHSDNHAQHALLFIDLDNFKRINDSLGHGVGDELLIAVAEALQEILDGNKGLVARLGGDEFIVFLQDVDAWNHPAKIAQEILDRFGQTLKLSNNEILVSPSIGIVMSPENGQTAEELLRNADTAMYYAKKKGKNTFQFYTRQMNEQAKMRLTLENDLRQAIEKDEFVVFYQPKVNLATGKVSGLEALVRWRSEERGLVPPNEFIPLAEESGLIIPISQQVIEKACLKLRDWRARGIFDGKMAINLSAIQFYHENLWETVKNALHLAKIEAEAIEFEITEGMVMQDLSHSIQQMNTLKEMGVSLALDDFGVGYSSLGNLKEFPIDTLKIDRSFIWDLDDSARDRQLVASIVTLAHNLGIRVVAEGVETVHQVEALKSMNCEEIQGFIYSPPVPDFEIEKLLTDANSTLDKALEEAAEDLFEG
ncbi:EAL domain-containing protein [Kangiella sp. TOML190]|uniref:EAL domain-containing protein n=1 Tax=Kangiella sp. TOML190 TaxID=2931351 RepID=UPI00204102AC|nr:EAL domain-containing protein [Kangiella sp. TOML190]